MVALHPGETAKTAIDRTAAEGTPLDGSTDGWIGGIVDILCRHNPWAKIVEDQRDGDHRRCVVVEDPNGPVSVTVRPGQVQLLPRSGWTAPPDRPGVGFAAMWEYC